MTRIRQLIEDGDLGSLSQRYVDRYSDDVEVGSLATIVQIVTDPNGPDLGGTPESPWSDETWLNWLRNRVTDLERQSADELGSRFITTPNPLLDSIDRWSRFLQEYSRLAATVAEIEGWNDSSGSCAKNWLGFPPATSGELAMAESRLGVMFPSTIRSFFLTTNGWREDGWVHPQIDGLTALNWLRDTDPHLYSLAQQTELTPGPFKRDPDGARLTEYRLDFGTRVVRSIALNRDSNDTGTALVDPLADGDEWPCGVWAHWHTESPWSWDSFSSYMYSRYNYLLDIERDA